MLVTTQDYCDFLNAPSEEQPWMSGFICYNDPVREQFLNSRVHYDPDTNQYTPVLPVRNVDLTGLGMVVDRHNSDGEELVNLTLETAYYYFRRHTAKDTKETMTDYEILLKLLDELEWSAPEYPECEEYSHLDYVSTLDQLNLYGQEYSYGDLEDVFMVEIKPASKLSLHKTDKPGQVRITHPDSDIEFVLQFYAPRTPADLSILDSRSV